VTLEVRLRPEAEMDMAGAAVWYEARRPGLGQEFLDCVRATFDAIAERPNMCSIVHRRTRRALLHRFPFGVYYRIETDAIVVIAVMHGSRRRGQKGSNLCLFIYLCYCFAMARPLRIEFPGVSF